MSRPRCLVVASFLLALATVSAEHANAGQACDAVLRSSASVEVAFSPWDDAEGLLLNAIDQAKQQILVQAYLLTSRKIADSLIAARMRGLDIKILADARQHAETSGSLLNLLAQAGIPVWLETKYRSAHNKIMLIDAEALQPVIISGSFNFTWSAQNRNAENLLLIRGNPALVRQFSVNWMRHRNEATLYSPP